MIFKSRKAIEDNALVASLSKSQAVMHFSMEGDILWANENFLQPLGYTLEELQEKNHKSFFPVMVANGPDYKKLWEGLNAGEFKAGEYRFLGKGGREVWVQASYNPLPGAGGVPSKVVMLATDVTAIRLKNADFEGQINAIGKSQSVIHFNVDGTIQWANSNFLSGMGYTLEEIVGQHHRMFVPPEEAQSEAYKQFWDELKSGKYQAGEYKRIGKGGREIWIHASYNPILNPNGMPFKIVKYATDNTKEVLKKIETDRVGQQVDQGLSKILNSVETAGKTASAVSAAAAETSSMVQTVAAAAEEMSSSALEISQSMTKSKQSVVLAQEETSEADVLTQQLSRVSDSMSDVVEFIQDIAGQINLLALNATIESARAGEAGKGFAVVASEVKNLAGQVDSATMKISQEIQDMQMVAADMVSHLSKIRSTMGQVSENVMAASTAVEQQSTVTSEISANMQSASIAVDEIDKNLEEVTAAIVEAAENAQAGTSLYQQLKNL
ncbi:MAG: PAS domain-containing methyl-accepting chemotaxis protein [Alphaproteobacteria bacterium]|nr:PAS domain-containing methyl-accepting chemotaxis protein [Alphaproteobacteria bacterium]